MCANDWNWSQDYSMALILDKEMRFNAMYMARVNQIYILILEGIPCMLPNCTEKAINTCSIVIHVVLPINEV